MRRAWVAVLCATACGASPTNDGPIGTSSAPIIDGVASSAQQDYVVQLVHPIGVGAFVCSGSLVAPNLVLTARHCVTTVPDEGFSCDENGNGTDGGTLGPDYEPGSIYIYEGLDAPDQFTQPSASGTRLFHDGATNLCNHDLALIEISPPITGVPLATLDLDSQLTSGEVVTAVGWGLTQTGMTPNVRQQLTGIAILAVGPASDSAGYDVASSEFEVGESICSGDSGGPALDPANAIVGIVSRGGNGVTDASATDPEATCIGAGTVNVYTETAPFRDVILDALDAVGATPTLVSVPIGETCTGSTECSSGLCATVMDDAGMTCTQECATSACPSGFRCDVGANGSYCVPSPSSGCSMAKNEPREADSGVAFLGFAVAALAFARPKRRVSS